MTALDTPRTAAALRLVLGRIVRRLRGLSGDTTLSAGQVSVLATLDESGTLRLRDLAAAEGVRPPTATRLVDGLVERDLVVRTPDPTDARGTLLSLTTEGVAVLETARTQRAAVLAEALDRLPDADQQRLAEALPSLEALLAELRAPVPATASR